MSFKMFTIEKEDEFLNVFLNNPDREKEVFVGMFEEGKDTEDFLTQVSTIEKKYQEFIEKKHKRPPTLQQQLQKLFTVNESYDLVVKAVEDLSKNVQTTLSEFKTEIDTLSKKVEIVNNLGQFMNAFSSGLSGMFGEEK